MTLIQGKFSSKDALEIITQMVHVKIKYHEGKINNTNNEEDNKFREAKIKQLQRDLFEIRKYIEMEGGKINIQSDILLTK